jgi:hypothetical protein
LKVKGNLEGDNYINKRKELQLSKQSFNKDEEVLFAHKRRSAAQRLKMSPSESSIWLKTLEFLHFQIFHSKQVKMVEHAFWLGKVGPGRERFQRSSIFVMEMDDTPKRDQKL